MQSASVSAGLLQQLPVEIRLLILRSITDVSSLMKACRASPCLWRPYTVRKESVLESVLRNEIGPICFPLAIASDVDLLDDWEDLHLRDVVMPSVMAYGELYLSNSATVEGPLVDYEPGSKWHSLGARKAIMMSENHSRISRLATLCANYYAHRSDENGPRSLCSGPITSTELDRYKKALYIYNILPLAFDIQDDDDMYDEVWKPLWDHFTPWEFLQVKLAASALGDLLTAKISEDLHFDTIENATEGRISQFSSQTQSLAKHIVDDDTLEREGARSLLSPRSWNFRTDGLLPLLHTVGYDVLDPCLHQQTGTGTAVDRLLDGLGFEDKFLRANISIAWRLSLLCPSSTTVGGFKANLLEGGWYASGGTIRSNMWESGAARNIWLWLCLEGAQYAGLDDNFEEKVVLWDDERRMSLMGAPLFWDLEKLDGLSDPKIPSFREITAYIDLADASQP